MIVKTFVAPFATTTTVMNRTTGFGDVKYEKVVTLFLDKLDARGVAE
jgi:hypothetical protein